MKTQTEGRVCGGGVGINIMCKKQNLLTVTHEFTQNGESIKD